LFGLGIHRGLRPMAILALLGGVMGVFSVWQSGFIEYFLSDGAMLVKAYAAVYILAMLLTIFPMAYLLLNANYRKYADMHTKLTQELAAEYKIKKLDK
jgi:low affinity Fe/Cu permease